MHGGAGRGKVFTGSRVAGAFMGSYLKREMHGNEHIIYTAELHWIVYHFGLLTTIVGALLGHFGPLLITLATSPAYSKIAEKPVHYIALGIILIGALHLFFGLIRQISTELVITNRRVIAKYGYISTTTYELMLPKVEGANIDQTIPGRILGYGTVMVKGTGGGISPIHHVANPYRFHAYLMKTLESLHQGERSRTDMDSGRHD
jgi:hypothetical protein